MGVFQWFVKLLYHSLLFLIRLPRPVFAFITGLFGVMDKSQKSVTQGSSMGNSSSSFKDDSEQYDSTWEDEPDQDPTETPEQSSWGPYRNRHAAQDMQAYRRYYQLTVSDGWTDDDDDDDDMEDDEDSPNMQFYRNKIRFYPNGVRIEDFHEYWSEDYDKLEYVHSYIQWLFPIQEKGMNYQSQELSLKEIKVFRRDETVKKRLLQSYKIMLGFYGIELVSEESGEVKRAENWTERFENLNRNTHNNLRITRIIKSLGLLGFGHYQKPLVQFFLNEVLVEGSLQRVKQSVLDYFMFAVLDKKERKELIKFAFFNFTPRDEFVWCPRRIRIKFLKEKETKSNKTNADQNEGKSSDPTSQSDQNDLTDSTVQNGDEIKTDTSNGKSSSSESRNDENVPGERQESEKQALPATAAGNANTCDPNEGTEGVDSEHDGHKNSEVEATIQMDVSKAGNEITNSGQKAREKSHENGNEDADSTKETKSADNSTENLPQTSDHSSKSENFANETPLSDPESEQQDQQDDSGQGNTEEFKSQHTDGDSKEKKSEEIQTSGSESPEDSVATGTETDNEANSPHCNETESADNNTHEHTLSEEEDNASSGHFEQTSEQNPVSSKETHTPGPDRNKDDEQQESDQSINEEKNVQNLDEGNEQKNQEDETLNQLKATAEAKGQADEKTEDPLHQDNTEERFTDDGVSNVITSHNNENSDSADVRNRDSAKSEQGTALKSDMNSSQGIPDEDTETGESSNEKSV